MKRHRPFATVLPSLALLLGVACGEITVAPPDLSFLDSAEDPGQGDALEGDDGTLADAAEGDDAAQPDSPRDAPADAGDSSEGTDGSTEAIDVFQEATDALPDTGPKPCEVDKDCDDGDLCTIDRCPSDTKTCVLRPFCDDGNPCTDDRCDTAEGCSFVDNVAACDDGNPCTVDDRCSARACTPGLVNACDDEDPCTVDSCDPATGCGHAPGEGSCEDGNRCTEGDRCADGSCVAGIARVCEDLDPCTSDSCDPATGCLFEFNTASCDDGDPCTTADACTSGTCVGQPRVCDDGDPCTIDKCTPDNGCITQPSTGECDDGNACTKDDTCVDQRCVGATLTTCDDRNPCTVDRCDPQSGCVAEAVSDGSTCDDGDPCTIEDACRKGTCTAGGPQDCDDGQSCTTDSCKQGVGCLHEALADNTGCDDGNACTPPTQDRCSAGICKGVGKSCDDGNQCTTDSCNPETQECSHFANQLACDDRNACTANDQCLGGQCTGISLRCSDQNPCTNDSCDPVAGCRFQPNTAGCNDGDPCTTGDHCVDSACKPGSAVACEPDGNPCTDDACQPGLGCTYPANTASCMDDSLCTTDDRCTDKACAGGGTLNCDDGNPCTTDTCDPFDGCEHVNNTVACTRASCDESGNFHPAAYCRNGSCPATTPVICMDTNQCTLDTCDPAKGCLFTNSTGVCSDGNDCTGPDLCSAGSCVAGPANACSSQPEPHCNRSGGCGCCAGGLLLRTCIDCDPATADTCTSTGTLTIRPVCRCGTGDVCTNGNVCKQGACKCGTAKACANSEVCCSCGRCATSLGLCAALCTINLGDDEGS